MSDGFGHSQFSTGSAELTMPESFLSPIQYAGTNLRHLRLHLHRL
ncbi:hypothetical protein Hsw_0414 [Hymenobacter swuensis DY53]|uniref:Uncharacterized protein n=1 Tax=Hymenobacter swuensis DY53 TaxID=1227739 RepID=W8ES96_9BACT|nr:hypothetical protein Hsw_0414 [Hymenobacter swuensis DY53]